MLSVFSLSGHTSVVFDNVPLLQTEVAYNSSEL